MSDGLDGNTSWGVALGSVLTAFFGGLVLLIKAIFKGNQTSQDRQLKRLESVISGLESKIDHLQYEHSSCREEAAQLRMCLLLLYDYAKRQNAALVKAGIPIEPIPDLPPLRRYEHTDEE